MIYGFVVAPGYAPDFFSALRMQRDGLPLTFMAFETVAQMRKASVDGVMVRVTLRTMLYNSSKKWVDELREAGIKTK